MIIKTYYFNARPNFGDELNLVIPKRLFNIDISKASVYDCDATFIGSILSPFLTDKDLYNTRPVKVWGSGFISEETNKTKLIRNFDVYAVRGNLTKARLEKYLNKSLDNIVLGDPGLLCSKLYENLDLTKEFDYGIIPHYVDLKNENLKKLNLKNYTIIDPTLPPYEFIKQLVKCKKILSSAMHGLIAADSFCIPNIRLILSDKIIGGDYKYNDYYSALNINNHNKLDLTKIESILEEVDFEYTITKTKIEKIQNALIERFPYK